MKFDTRTEAEKQESRDLLAKARLESTTVGEAVYSTVDEDGTFDELPQYGDNCFEATKDGGYFWSGSEYGVEIVPSENKDRHNVFEINSDGINYFEGTEGACCSWITDNMDDDGIISEYA